jgi:hypothetical protein
MMPREVPGSTMPDWAQWLPEGDPVNHPPHYQANGIEVLDVIEAFGLNFHLGCVLKYLLRADRKGNALEDLKKGRFYLDREIARRERA